MTAPAIVAVLLEVSWRSVLVAALVGGVLWLWRVKGGAVRHTTWTAGTSAPVAAPTSPRAAATQTAAGFVAQVASPPASQVPEAAMASSGFTWPQIVLMVWLSGVVVSLAFMLMGWRLARRLAASARTSEIDPRVLGSTAVSTPCAVGVWRAHVLMPRVWRTWSRAGRDAVLHHELAHVQRRDLFVAFLARLNRAVFWFNPIAWWLERRIAAAAEQACDEAVLLSGQDPQRYAEVLVAMAGALQSGGGRVAWQSLGMVNGSDLESRVGPGADG